VALHRIAALEVGRIAQYEDVYQHADDQHQREHDGHEKGSAFRALFVIAHGHVNMGWKIVRSIGVDRRLWFRPANVAG
jgi:hypothetical protein